MKKHQLVLLFCCLLSIEDSSGFTDREIKGLNKFVGSIFGSSSADLVTKVENISNNIVLFGESYRIKMIGQLMIPVNRVAVERGLVYYTSYDQGMTSMWSSSERVYHLKCGGKDPEIIKSIESINDGIVLTENLMKVTNDSVVINDKLVVEFPEEYKKFRLAQHSGKIGFVVAFKDPGDFYGQLYAINLNSVQNKRWKKDEKIQPVVIHKDLNGTVKDVAVDQLTGNVVIAAGSKNVDFLQMLEKIYPININSARSEKMIKHPSTDCLTNPVNNEMGLLAMKNVIQRASEMILNEYEQIQVAVESTGESFCSDEKNEIERQSKEIKSLKAKLEHSKFALEQMRIALSKKMPYQRTLPFANQDSVKDELDTETEKVEREYDEIEDLS